MAVPMAERLTMVRLCLRPAPHRRPLTRRHFCPTATPVPPHLPRSYPATPIFRFKVPACAPERNLANFYYLRPIFQPGPSAYIWLASERQVAAPRLTQSTPSRNLAEVRLKNRPIYHTLIRQSLGTLLTFSVIFRHIISPRTIGDMTIKMSSQS